MFLSKFLEKQAAYLVIYLPQHTRLTRLFIFLWKKTKRCNILCVVLPPFVVNDFKYYLKNNRDSKMKDYAKFGGYKIQCRWLSEGSICTVHLPHYSAWNKVIPAKNALRCYIKGAVAF